MSFVAAVVTHRHRPQDTQLGLDLLIETARRRGAVLRFSAEEAAKHGIEPGEGIEVGPLCERETDICFALGGDGTILSALRSFARTDTPVFAINYGAIGFLATVEREQVASAIELAFAGDFEVLHLPGISVTSGEVTGLAINDVSIQREPSEQVAHLAYSVGGDEVGHVRCDGLVISTPAGSTGYNLANGGPVMAWGVEGYAVSFIAPHSLTARALVVAPDDPLSVHNVSSKDEVGVAIDGRPITMLAPDAHLQARFVRDCSHLAQIDGANFYGRLREKFGRLASLL